VWIYYGLKKVVEKYDIKWSVEKKNIVDPAVSSIIFIFVLYNKAELIHLALKQLI
jgi:hypothetical protein